MTDGSGACEATDQARHRAAEIAERARERNRARTVELAGWVDAARGRGLTEEERQVAAEVAHQLAGSAGTFGYQQATDSARELERLLGEGQTAQDWDRAEAAVATIVESLNSVPDRQS